MATTTIPAFTKALIVSLNGRAGFIDANVEVVNGPPTISKAQSYAKVWFGDAKGNQDFVNIASPQNPKVETYTIDVVVDIIRTTKDMDRVIDEAFLLLAEIENELRATPQQGVANVLWSGLNGPVEHYKRRNDSLCQAIVYAGVFVKARI